MHAVFVYVFSRVPGQTYGHRGRACKLHGRSPRVGTLKIFLGVRIDGKSAVTGQLKATGEEWAAQLSDGGVLSLRWADGPRHMELQKCLFAETL